MVSPELPKAPDVHCNEAFPNVFIIAFEFKESSIYWPAPKVYDGNVKVNASEILNPCRLMAAPLLNNSINSKLSSKTARLLVRIRN